LLTNLSESYLCIIINTYLQNIVFSAISYNVHKIIP